MKENPFQRHNPLGLRGTASKTLEQVGVKIELAEEKDWEDYRNIRIEAIDTDPIPLNVNNEEEALVKKNRTEEEWKEDLREDLIFLAKQNLKTVGMAKGMKREENVW